MSGVFDDVVFQWAGVPVVIPARNVLGAICACEDVITMHELYEFAERGTCPQARIACAYGAVLRYAGVKVDNDDVYERALKGAGAVQMNVAIRALIQMMLPKSAKMPKVAPPKGKEKPRRSSSSKRHTKRQSDEPRSSTATSSGD